MKRSALWVVLAGSVIGLSGDLWLGERNTSPPTAPAPVRPDTPVPAPKAKGKLYLFTQPNCPPCERVRKALADPALAEEMQRWDIREIQKGDPLWKQYKIQSTPTLIAVGADGKAHRANGGAHTLGELLAFLAEIVVEAVGKFAPGGPAGPNGEQVVCDLPASLRMKNVGGRDGAGLCVFTSINHSAHWQNERRLWNFQKDMRHERGGGWPQKVDDMIAKYGAGTNYMQYEGRDPSVLELALKTGRMPGVTYNGHDGVFYRQYIAHMVNLVYLDQKAAAILDNNNPDKILWMSRGEFLTRWSGGRNGWAVVLLSPRPPAPPHH